MRRGIITLLIALAGCTAATQERVQDYNQDGIILFRQGDYQGARQSFLAAQALVPSDPALLYNIGESCDRAGDVAAAENYYRECLAQAPGHAECRHALAALYLHTNRRDEAARVVADWLAREPHRAAAYAEDGWLSLEAGDLPRAQARLQQALQLDAHETRALVELARVYEMMQRPDRAVALYERALRQSPEQTEIAAHLTALRSQGAGRPRPE
jgi:tetratricopeptide (TPR) repeat protein